MNVVQSYENIVIGRSLSAVSFALRKGYPIVLCGEEDNLLFSFFNNFLYERHVAMEIIFFLSMKGLVLPSSDHVEFKGDNLVEIKKVNQTYLYEYDKAHIFTSVGLCGVNPIKKIDKMVVYDKFTCHDINSYPTVIFCNERWCEYLIRKELKYGFIAKIPGNLNFNIPEKSNTLHWISVFTCDKYELATDHDLAVRRNEIYVADRLNLDIKRRRESRNPNQRYVTEYIVLKTYREKSLRFYSLRNIYHFNKLSETGFDVFGLDRGEEREWLNQRRPGPFVTQSISRGLFP